MSTKVKCAQEGDDMRWVWCRNDTANGWDYMALDAVAPSLDHLKELRFGRNTLEESYQLMAGTLQWFQSNKHIQPQIASGTGHFNFKYFIDISYISPQAGSKGLQGQTHLVLALTMLRPPFTISSRQTQPQPHAGLPSSKHFHTFPMKT